MKIPNEAILGGHGATLFSKRYGETSESRVSTKRTHLGQSIPRRLAGVNKKNWTIKANFCATPARGKRLPESGRLEKAIQLRKIAERSQLSWGCPA